MANPIKPPLDPHTARALRELQGICKAIESGEAGVVAFADSIESEPRIARTISARIGYQTRKP